MYRRPPAPVRASIEADNPVVLAGLRRIAALVGILEASAVHDRDITLRSASDGRSHSGIEVNCSNSAVVVTVSSRPSPELWSVIFDLVGYLVPADERPPEHGD